MGDGLMKAYKPFILRILHFGLSFAGDCEMNVGKFTRPLMVDGMNHFIVGVVYLCNLDVSVYVPRFVLCWFWGFQF